MELTVADVTITPELRLRPVQPPNVEAEIAAIHRLANAMAADPSSIFQECADLALELCRADTCGISLRERTDAGEDVFRWIAMAGRLKDHLHGTTPRFFSPCGICVDSNAPLLMRRPELVYKYLDVGPPFQDVLLIPLTEKGSRIEGTIWIVAHDPARKFDAEDTRVMQRLAVFTATALQMSHVVKEARAVAAQKEVLSSELEHRIKNTLQMTASLLRLQVGTITDPIARAAVETARRRVLALSQTHRIGADSASGDVVDVIKSVCADLSEAAGPDIHVETQTEAIILPPHKAAVTALIINELVTNAIKHAFSDRPAGTIAVTLRQLSAGMAELSVADDGAALPPDAATGRKQGLGLMLVQQLANQLGGKLKVDAEAKRFSVEFPYGVSRGAELSGRADH
jgi:two-component sensor histidine kinase